MKRIYLLLLQLVFTAGLLAVPQFNFKKYQVENGLSHNTVWCNLQDSYGFMWFGTSDGLNRFDGRDFIVYRNDHNNPLSLGNNSVQSLFEDDEKNLWVGTVNGIYIYDRHHDNFTFFDNKTEYGVSISSEVKKIIKTEKGTIWIGTLGQGIFIYNPETARLTQNSLLSSFVWDICEDKSHRIYISSLQDGLICLDQNGKYLETYSSTLSDEEKSKFSRISCIQSINNQIWFSLGNNRLCLLDNRTKQITYYDDNTQGIGVIRCIGQYSEREIMIGSDNGLYTFDIVSEKFTRIDNPVDARSLSDQTVNAILKDAEGGFWISTYLGGVNYLAQQSKIFEYYYPVNTGLKAGKVVNQFCEDKDRNIWIGTQDGLRIFNSVSRNIETYNLPGKNKNYDIRAVLFDGDDLWIGTFSDGLKVVDTKTGKLREYHHVRNKANSICSNDILSLFKDSRGNIFIGTSWGLCKYNVETDDFVTLIAVGFMTYVTDINEDSHGNLWVTSYNQGVFSINMDNYNWRSHFTHDPARSNTISSNSVICAFEDMHGNMWFGTNGSGLCYFDREARNFINFDPDNTILPNKVIYSIEEDNLGFFWISTNAGLLYINPANKSSGRIFTKDDGLQSNQFNFNASLKSSSGKLYFGGINGFNSFYPEEFQDNTYIPPVYITDIRVSSGSGKNTVSAGSDIPAYLRTEMSLPFNNNNITFRFSALSYEKSYRNNYIYTLEGFDGSWIDNGTSNVVTYTNLPPGNYVFRVKGSNNDDKWNEEGAIVHIRIMPPWWRSTVAYIVYILIIGGIALIFFRYWVKRTNKKIHSQMKEYELKKEKEVYQSKIDFFINLVHEIRTPLTLINLPLEKLSDTSKNNPKTIHYLSIINKNVNYLLGIVNQLLDFQKIESAQSRLDLQQQDLKPLLKDIYNQFVNVCELKNIELSLFLPDNEVVVPVDKDVLNKIIFNLLGNAIKYAKSKIELKLEISDGRFEISVSDDGPGIPENEKSKIFEAFYQLNNDNNSGTGIGLAFSKLLSEKHQGSISIDNSKWNGAEFRLSIPILNNIIPVENSASENIISPSDLKTIAEGDFNSCEVLLVEDNTELLTLMEESLSGNFTIHKAGNGQEALNILEKENIDLIVSDVMMPVMDGFEFTKTVKSDLNYSHIPVILLTAKVANEFHLEGMEYGADIYLGKPFPIKLLTKQIENLLKLKFAFRKMISVAPSAVDTSQINISKKDDEFVKKLYAEIDKHLTEFDFSIDNLAETMFMSRSNFYRKIKGLTGMSPNDFLKTIRLNKAAQLLLQTDCRVKEVYEQVGFNSSSYFAKCFKAQFGVLPKEYASGASNKNF